jgi:hypothetical protein
MGGVAAEIMTANQRGALQQGAASSAQSAMSVTQNVLDTTAALRSAMQTSGGSGAGILGQIRRIGTAARDNISQLASFGPEGATIASMANGALRDASTQVGIEGGLSEDTFNEFFNSELGGTDYLTNTLAYMVAKMRDDNGRISDGDLRDARNSLGLGALGSDALLLSALNQVDAEAQRKFERASRTYDRVMFGPAEEAFGQPGRQPSLAPQPDTQLDPNAPISDLINALTANQP